MVGAGKNQVYTLQPQKQGAFISESTAPYQHTVQWTHGKSQAAVFPRSTSRALVSSVLGPSVRGFGVPLEQKTGRCEHSQVPVSQVPVFPGFICGVSKIGGLEENSINRGVSRSCPNTAVSQTAMSGRKLTQHNSLISNGLSKGWRRET